MEVATNFIMIYSDEKNMKEIHIRVSENIQKYYSEISKKVAELIMKSTGRYFAYLIKSNTEMCKHEGWDWEIDFKEFNDVKQIYNLEEYVYTIIDKYKI